MFNELDPLLLNQLRLAIMSILLSVEEAEFTYIKKKTNATDGNLSVQINKLKKAGYISVQKSFRDNFPLTLCSITPAGVKAFEKHIYDLKGYLEPKRMTG